MNQTAKRRLAAALTVTVLALAAIVGYISLKPVSVSYSDSDIFSEEALQSAVACVKEDFKALKGCKLFALSYNGDETTLRETERQLRHGSPYDEYIVIDSKFLSPVFGGGGWNARRIYTWNWILGRSVGGEWVVIDRGYC